MANTYKLISKNILSSSQSSITFSSIPGTYTDLRVLCSTRNTSTSNGLYISFNGVNTNLSNIRLYSNASTVATYNGSDIIVYTGRSTYTTNVFDNTEIYIPNYAGSNYKSISIDNISENADTNNEVALTAGLWSSTSAITSITFTPSGNSFATNSSFYLYGIKNS